MLPLLGSKSTSFSPLQVNMYDTTVLGKNIKFNETQIGVGDKNQGLFENTGDKYNVLNYHSGTN